MSELSDAMIMMRVVTVVTAGLTVALNVVVLRLIVLVWWGR